MRRQNTEQIGQIIHQFLREEGLETPLNQHRLLNSLQEVLGYGIAKYIGTAFIRNQTLNVQIKSPVLRQELSAGRASLVRRLNEHVGAQVIADIRFY